MKWLLLILLSTPLMAQDRPEDGSPAATSGEKSGETVGSASQSASMQKESSADSAFYSTVEFAHQSDRFFDQASGEALTKPSLQTNLQLGHQMRGGQIDMYVTLGAIKSPGTQKVVQRRPEAEFDYYPANMKNFSWVFYNRVNLPFSEADYDKENAKVSRQGSIFTIGSTPKIRGTLSLNGTSFILSLGTDLWGTFYSRRQYIEDANTSPEDRGLLLSGDPEGESIEASVPMFHNEFVGGLGIYPLLIRGLMFEASVVSAHDHIPVYSYVGPGTTVNHSYRTDRTAHYRLRLVLQLTRKLALSNDFFHFHTGFFAQEVSGSDHHRFRNILRLSCQI